MPKVVFELKAATAFKLLFKHVRPRRMMSHNVLTWAAAAALLGLRRVFSAWKHSYQQTMVQVRLPPFDSIVIQQM